MVCAVLPGMAWAQAPQSGSPGLEELGLKEPALGKPAPSNPALGNTVEYILRVGETTVEHAGKRGVLLTVNGVSPAPTLRFTEGDHAHITVINDLEEDDTSLHWHGLLLPNAMDGVPYLTMPPIGPGEERVFEFPIRQSGTYWYHSHTGLQEQKGVYGAIVIDPVVADARMGAQIQAQWDREHVVVLSDWTHEDPHTVMGTLMHGSDWYSIQKGTASSIWGAWKAGKLRDYFRHQKTRMMAMDISDVAYDAFLAGGLEELPLEAQPGERVLLRIINAGASSYFHVTSAVGPMEVVGADGMPVVPVLIPRILIGNAETYDVVVTMPETSRRVEVRATAHDVSGHASVWLGQGPELAAQDPPAPDIYDLGESLAAGLASQIPKRGLEAIYRDRPFAPYAHLRSPYPTTVIEAGEEDEVRTLTMRLTGEMQRYLWGFDGKTLSDESVIRVSQGEVLRIKFVNDTMMHHPLHLHGHFFRVLNGQGDYAPLKHTVDVPPMGHRIIEWVADEEPGDWFFHCHILYHMDAGMTRAFSYRELGEDHQPQFDPKMIRPRMFHIMGSYSEHMSMGMAKVMEGKNDYYVKWMRGLHSGGGVGHDKDQEIDLGYSRYFDTNLSAFAAYRFSEVRKARDRAVLGVKYRLPYIVMTTWSADSEGDARLELDKDFQLTPRFGLQVGYEYDTNTYAEWNAMLEYTFNREFGIIASEHSDHGFGFGIAFRF